MIKEKLFVFVLLLAFSSNLALSQDVEVFNGGQFFVDRTEYVESVLEVDDDECSVLTRTGLIGNKFRVLNLDQNLMEKSKFEIEIPEVGGKKLKYFWSVKLGESIYFMSRYFDSKANDYYLYASELNVKTGAFVRHLEAVKVNRKEFKNLVNPFRAVRSVDSTKVLFITEYPTGANEDVQYGFKVVNSDMSEVWSKDVIFPIKDKAFSILDYDVDKDGNIHFTAAIRMTLDEKNDKNSKGRYYVNIYSYFHETGELVQYEVGFQNEVIRNMDLELTAENELVGIGFYSERSMVESYKGMFYLRIDPKTKEVKNKSLTPFGMRLPR